MKQAKIKYIAESVLKKMLTPQMPRLVCTFVVFTFVVCMQTDLLHGPVFEYLRQNFFISWFTGNLFSDLG